MRGREGRRVQAMWFGLLACGLLPILPGCGGKETTAPSDTTAPVGVTNLAVDSPTSTSLRLLWTAPGDDGNTGTALQYDVRYASSGTSWDLMVQATGEPAPKTSGQSESFTVTGLLPGTTYYFQLKTADEAPNWSLVSNEPNGTTLADPPPVFEGNVVFDPPSMEISLGNTFTVTATVRNGGGLGHYGGISISFPDFTNASDGQWVSSTSSDDLPGHGEHMVGSSIYDHNCLSNPAQYFLAEYGDTNWTSSEANTYTLTVQPQAVGQFEVYVRSALKVGTTGCVYVNAIPSGGSSDTDQQGWPVKRFTVTVTSPGSVPGNMVLVPAGTFTMGDGTAYCGSSQHQVTLAHGFYLGQHEVTNQEYRDAVQWAYDQGYVTATSSSVNDNLDGSTALLVDLADSCCQQVSFSGGSFTVDPGKEEYPIVAVSWFGSVAYCDWLSMQAGLARAYSHSTWQCNGGSPYTAAGYRLPTDAEWEFAAQCDDERIYPWGNESPSCSRANYWWGQAGSCVGSASVVGSYPAAPSSLGLYDMAGNVWEWCNDWHTCDLGTSEQTDPTGPGSGFHRVLRGGSWFATGGLNLRCSTRNYRDPSCAGNVYGFRCVRSH